MSDGHLAELVRARLGPSTLLRASVHGDTETLEVDPTRWVAVIDFLASDPDAQLEVLADLFAIDGGKGAEPRFEVRAVLRSPQLGYRAHVCRSAGGDEPLVPTLTTLFPAADALERELFEMHGVTPDGHPFLRPLLLYEGFVGHPLRRDYRAHKQQPLVPFLEAADSGGAAATLVTDAGEGAP